MMILFKIYYRRIIRQYHLLLLCGNTIQKNLCVEGFGIKYSSDEHAYYLLKFLQKYYAVTVDIEENHFC